MSPRRTCQPLGTPTVEAPRDFHPTARLLANIDAAIEAGQMAPWSHFERDRAMVAQLLTTHCQPCPELSPAGCDRVPWPCKLREIWRQTVLLGWCERWGALNGRLGRT